MSDVKTCWNLAHQADTQRLMGNYGQAQVLFKQALSSCPDSAWLKAHLAETYSQEGSYQLALDTFNEAIKLADQQGKKYAWAHAHRGIAVFNMGDYAGARKDLGEAITIAPNYAWAYANRGMTYRWDGKYQEAESDFTQAININSEYAWAYAYRSVVRSITKQYEGAWKDLMRATSLDPMIMLNAREFLNSPKAEGLQSLLEQERAM